MGGPITRSLEKWGEPYTSSGDALDRLGSFGTESRARDRERVRAAPVVVASDVPEHAVAPVLGSVRDTRAKLDAALAVLRGRTDVSDVVVVCPDERPDPARSTTYRDDPRASSRAPTTVRLRATGTRWERSYARTAAALALATVLALAAVATGHWPLAAFAAIPLTRTAPDAGFRPHTFVVEIEGDRLRIDEDGPWHTLGGDIGLFGALRGGGCPAREAIAQLAHAVVAHDLARAAERAK